MNLKMYLEQHKAIVDEISIIEGLMKNTEFEDNANEIALHISTLAGKIRVHLSMEDKYMYPSLEKQSDNRIKEMSKHYQDEMGGLASEFVTFKDKYNTKQKILENKDKVQSETKQILQAIKQRVQREEKELYNHIQ